MPICKATPPAGHCARPYAAVSLSVMLKIRQKTRGARAILLWQINPLEARMSTKEKTKQDGELSEQQLDKVAGGQKVPKMETIIGTANRPEKAVKMETIVVPPPRDNPDLPGTRPAQADTKSKKTKRFPCTRAPAHA